MRWPFSIERGEMLDTLAASPLGRALEPLTLLHHRNAQTSLSHESTRVLTLAFAYAHSERVVGDYAEFGVWRGRTFVEAWRVARRYPTPRRFVAFDSFEGLPEVGGIDAGGQFSTEQFRHGRAAFEARLRRARVPAGQVTIVEGFFDDTLAHPERIGLDHVAVAWVDCDLYASTVPVLDYLTPRLSQGAVLLFDDWFCFQGDRDKGESRACREWLERNPELSLVPWQRFNWAGQAFLVRRSHDGAQAA
jgi:hypothetical protein